ncbi:putative ABC transporter ATP-binding protein YdiF [Geobacter sp. OR-1]|uniref:ABC-F family ATP-binding cassette domain-containing protein n=1 Tax=Geobacter sp. OR-1 TaxID=1266765 RepID=UPI0005431D0E|nr:ABC-F family ATP-binding cassette domain-containing protein [Geobacter sp. OR-1]GAM09032.1 putative ABC transporter ATP-binding protein YdiF [Geobacter sp. OR-1]
MLQLANLTKEFAGKPLFTDINWHLPKGERVGLVGENGAGKSTLMRIITGEVETSSGEIRLAKGATVGYLPQEGIVTRGRSLFEEGLAALADLQAMGNELQELEQRMTTVPYDAPEHEALLERYGHIQEQFRVRGGYAMEAEVAKVLRGLGFDRTDWDRDCGDFSGGWQMRIALARLLLQKPNVLLLDEPTNHLDIEARNWLEEYLCGYPYSVILVSHDRFFLDQVCHRITEVWNHTLTDYHCSYSSYLVQREERVSALREAKRRQDEEVAAMEDFIRRFRYNANKASLVQSRIKQLEKVERIILPPERKRIRFRFPSPPKSGRVVMELASVCKLYGEKEVLRNIGLTVESGERVALVGHNGAGKSTLMRILNGETFQSGERHIGHNVSIDFFAQDQALVMDQQKSAYEELLAASPYDMVPQLRDILGAFLFSGDDIHKRVGVLSGGEKNRLALARMLLKPANLLLMDEPTNHLDLFSKDVLLDALRSFSGTVVFVSHDRHFIDGLATRVVEVEDCSLTSYLGDYEYYLAKKAGGDVGAIRELPTRDTPISKEDRQQQREADKQRQKEERVRQKRVAELEAAIAADEGLLQEVATKLADPAIAGDYQAIHAAAEEHSVIEARLKALYAEWEETAALTESS